MPFVRMSKSIASDLKVSTEKTIGYLGHLFGGVPICFVRRLCRCVLEHEKR